MSCILLVSMFSISVAELEQVVYVDVVSLEQIAKKAGVSKASASLALNDKPGVSEATRKRIVDIAREMGYVPRSLVRADDIYRNNTYVRFVACAQPDILGMRHTDAPFFHDLIQFLERSLRERGFSLAYATFSKDHCVNELQQTETASPSRGMVLLGTNIDESLAVSMTGTHDKVIVLDSYYRHRSINCVVMNNVQGAYAATHYLIDLGHHSIGYVGSQQRIANFDLRRQGFDEAIQEAPSGVEHTSSFSVPPTIEGARQAFARALDTDGHTLPTALFCENDYIAIGVVKGLTDLGIRVPDDVSVIGFDDIPQATVINPELTTMRVDRQAMAEEAARRLSQLVEEDCTSTTMVTMIDTSLIERQSCAAPAERTPQMKAARRRTVQ